MLLRMALDGLTQSLTRLDAAYEPLTWARASLLRAMAKTALADLDGEVGAIAEAMNDLVEVLEHVGRHHSPLDWVKAQTALGEALQMLGEAGGGQTSAFEQSIACLDRALTVLERRPTLALTWSGLSGGLQSPCGWGSRAGPSWPAMSALPGRGGDGAASRAGSDFKPTLDPVGWAVRQLNFARLYEARARPWWGQIRRRSPRAPWPWPCRPRWMCSASTACAPWRMWPHAGWSGCERSRRFRDALTH